MRDEWSRYVRIYVVCLATMVGINKRVKVAEWSTE
jgi:hypothetical protein